MAPLTDACPKALLPVGGRPFLDWQLRWLAREGVNSVILCVGHLGNQVLRFVEEEQGGWGIEITVVNEGATPRGTGGALRLAYDEGLLNERFFVLYGDSYLRVPIGEVWDAFGRSACAALMTVCRSDYPNEANVVFRHGIIERYEKGLLDPPPEMHYVDYGLSVLRRTTVEQWIAPDAFTDLSATFAILSRRGDLAGFESSERFFEIGSLAGLEQLESLLLG